MKKIVLLLAAISVYGASVHGQKTDFSVRAGLNLTTHLCPELDFNVRPGFTAGAFADFYVSDLIFFQTGVNYSMKGLLGKEKHYNKAGVSLYETTDRQKATLHYIEVPVHLGFDIPTGGRSSVQITLGPYMAVGVGGRIRETINGVAESKFDAFGPEGYRRFDVGWNWGAGVKCGKFFYGAQYGVGMARFFRISDRRAHEVNLAMNLTFTAGVYF